MCRTECPTQTATAVVSAAVAELLATLRKHLANPDPKVSLKAATELTKLLAVLGRNKLLTDPTPATPPPAPAEPVPTAKRVTVIPPAERPTPTVANRERLDAIPPLPGRRLTSFLGQPAAPPARTPARG